ncbi:TVP38/TMEM64 family protein [Devosia sp. BSSL-BM10]|uniref:TVP38/TMEM64 family membrane protein n=1 Tax=Devosia litorisediminis TaxID=2829817 RepID=A0A942EDL5_9HYPH|nr:TVP38/TMEM64 family protein [Devosia litorisediminis]MBS3850005.1 TVP38/TMEM64 family protein [Devosia litorisediminis]
MNDPVPAADAASKGTASRGLSRFVPIAILLGVLITGLLLGWQRYFTLDYLAEAREGIKAFASQNGLLAALIYVLGYAVATAVAFPAAWLLTVAGGFVYGAFLGGTLAAIGATIGASVLFWAAKTAFGDSLRQRVGGFVDRAAQGFENNAFSYMLALRLAPVFPFAVVNVLPALLKVPFSTYFIATLIGILPGALVYASIGQGLETVLIEVAESGRDVSIGDLITPGLSLGLLGLALLAIAPPIFKLVRSRWLKA